MMLQQRSQRGQSLVEFALILPIFVLVLAGIFDLGRAVFAYNTISNASREAVRVAIVNQTATDVQNEALKQGVSLGLSATDVTITYADPDGSGALCPAPYSLGCVATITVQYSYTAATPVISQIIGPFLMTATTEMAVERTCPDPSNSNLLTCPWP
jgi:Flp pilus assembly protein TadG